VAIPLVADTLRFFTSLKPPTLRVGPQFVFAKARNGNMGVIQRSQMYPHQRKRLCVAPKPLQSKDRGLIT